MVNQSQIDELRKIFKIKSGDRMVVTRVSRGYNIRIYDSTIKFANTKESFMSILLNSGKNMTSCERCGKSDYCHPHHIIPVSAGGQNDPDNGLALCFNCHIGDDGIHRGKWDISECVLDSKLRELKIRYGVINED